ncbi:MAG: HAMP domain-containing protein [Spirochaetaceae bacterium]|nr:MAG: HAMP domain-containing protein [Spirochaetaceae bacterium]
MFIRLSTKLTALLVAIIVIGSASTLIAISHISRRQFFSYVQQSDRQRAQELAQLLAEVYQDQGSFSGVEQLLRLQRPGERRVPGMTRMHQQMHGPAGRMMMRAAGPERLLLLDRNRRVVAATIDWAQQSFEVQRAEQYGVAVSAAGETVGWLLVGSMIDGSFNPAQEQFLRSLRFAVILSALLVALLAFVLGAFFLSNVTRPLRALSTAARSIASGNLAVGIPTAGNDEIGTLAESFGTMRAALDQSRRQRELLFRNIAHELRTPLSLLRGEVEAMIDGLYPVNALSLRSLQQEIAVLDRLVSDIRSITTMQSADFSLEYWPVDVAAVLARLKAAFAREASEQGIEIEVRCDNELPMISADPGRLTQVLANLIANALHHSHSANRIVLAAQLQGDGSAWLEISVRDNGRGVPEAQLEHIFDRLYRVDDARSRSSGGSGLGLAIARQIVEAHGGSIWAAAVAGGGLQVSARLPCARQLEVRE